MCDEKSGIKPKIFQVHQDDNFSITCFSNMALSGDKYTHINWKKTPTNDSSKAFNTKTLKDIHMNHTIWDVEELLFQNFSRSDAGTYTCINTKCNKSVVAKLLMIGMLINFSLEFKVMQVILSL